MRKSVKNTKCENRNVTRHLWRMTRHIGSLYDPPDTVTRPLGSCTAMTSILGFRVALGGIVGAGVRPVYHDKPTNVRILFRKFHQNPQIRWLWSDCSKSNDLADPIARPLAPCTPSSSILGLRVTPGGAPRGRVRSVWHHNLP